MIIRMALLSYIDSLTFGERITGKCSKCDSSDISYASQGMINKYFCENCYDDSLDYGYDTDGRNLYFCLYCLIHKYECRLGINQIGIVNNEVIITASQCYDCIKGVHKNTFSCYHDFMFKVFCNLCMNTLTNKQKNLCVFRKVNVYSYNFKSVIYDLSPRHQDISHLPLEVIEKFTDTYHLFRIGYISKNDIGPIKNWLTFSCVNVSKFKCTYLIGFLINIKDLRIKCYISCNTTFIVDAFDSYQQYLEAKESWLLSLDELKGNDLCRNSFEYYWIIKNDPFPIIHYPVVSFY